MDLNIIWAGEATIWYIWKVRRTNRCFDIRLKYLLIKLKRNYSVYLQFVNLYACTSLPLGSSVTSWTKFTKKNLIVLRLLVFILSTSNISFFFFFFGT